MTDSTTLLQDFCPVLRMDSDEPFAPCSFEAYVAGCSLHRLADDTQVAAVEQFTLAAHADDDEVYLRLDSPVAVPEGLGDVLPTVPVYGKSTMFSERGVRKYALLYVWLWPYQEAASADPVLTHPASIKHMRLIVDRGTRRLERAFYPGTGLADADGGWVQAAQLKFEDKARRRPLAFVAKGTHSLWPQPGFAWRVRGSISDTMDGAGQAWRHSRVEPLPADVLAFAGRLAKAVPPLKETPWLDRVEQDEGSEAMTTRIVPLRGSGGRTADTSHAVGRSGHVRAGR